MAVWRLVTHHEHPEEMLEWARTAQRLAIGWGRVGDLSAMQYASPEAISKAIVQQYPSSGNAPSGGRCLWAFWRSMRYGDLVILSTANRRRAVMRVTGAYEYAQNREAPPVGDYQHQREAVHVDTDPDVLWEQAGGVASDFNIRWTLVRCVRDVRL